MKLHRLPLVLALLFMGSLAQAGDRVALVIGNSAYTGIAPLANPVADADLMAATLEKVGFEVTKVNDASQIDIKRAMLEFSRRLEKGVDASLFYYAGHGVQSRGRNYLIPVDAEITRDDELDLLAVDVNDFLRVMNGASSKVNIVVLDACRDNPYQSEFRSATRGLAMVDAPRGTYIAYSTAPGNVAEDGSGANSPYTQALTSAILSPGIKLEDAFKRARRDVLRATNNRQVPWETSSIIGDFYFQPGTDSSSTTAGAIEGVEATETTTQDIEATIKSDYELAAQIDTTGAWDAFLARHGAQRGNFYVALAVAAREKLQDSSVSSGSSESSSAQQEQQTAALEPADEDRTPATNTQDNRPIQLGIYSDWTTYKVRNDKGFMCYAVTKPIRSTGSLSDRDSPYFIVTTYDYQDVEEPSAIMGYQGPLKRITTEVGDRTFNMLASNGTAWVGLESQQLPLVQAMKAGRTLTFTAEGRDGDLIVDTYSLSGVSAAIEDTRIACE